MNGTKKYFKNQAGVKSSYQNYRSNKENLAKAEGYRKKL